MRFSNKAIQKFCGFSPPSVKRKTKKQVLEEYFDDTPKHTYKYAGGSTPLPFTRIRYRDYHLGEDGKPEKPRPLKTHKRRRKDPNKPNRKFCKKNFERDKIDRDMDDFLDLYQAPVVKQSETVGADSLLLRDSLRAHLRRIHEPTLFKPGVNQGRIINWFRIACKDPSGLDLSYWKINELSTVVVTQAPIYKAVAGDHDTLREHWDSWWKNQLRPRWLPFEPERELVATIPVKLGAASIAIFMPLNEHLMFLKGKLDQQLFDSEVQAATADIIGDFVHNRRVPFEFLDEQLRESALSSGIFPYTMS